ncbi:hypothetical protein CROQUDRAFT_717565 [Cronartium quercuum f. sp. fusiforme G11]|uniref:BRCT domain-containing protein n=1 Tax=Cronartium quercuum f. sp. fusiforme G11 TaxID=708437 RepID=A0A9P6NAP0_9BASI|nr:hypothetical protein CROQUDRAFT_717565 [Cronartium quercuum f. sp. fusiforme G11]
MGFGSKRGGTKVPNAKLKPVPVQAVSCSDLITNAKPSNRNNKGKGKQMTSLHPEFEEEDDEDRSTFRESLCREKPLLSGYVICFSGILDPVKSQARAYAEKLGGTVTKALTLDVTHLICDKPGSDKYCAAIDNNIKVMLPMWLEALYSSFTEGENVDVAKITTRYAMKPFHNLKFSITGSSSIPRTTFIQMAEDNGATISIDLDIDCTHLVVLAASSSSGVDPSLFELDKVQAARKAQPAIRVVWQEWLEDSVERGGCLSESAYLMKEGVPRPGRLHLRPSTLASASRSGLDAAQNAQDHCVNESQVVIRKRVTRTGSQAAMLASIISERDLPSKKSFSRIRSTNERVASPDLEQDLPDRVPQDFQQHKPATAPTPGALDSPAQLNNLLDQSKAVDRRSLVKKLSSVRSSKFESSKSQRSEESPSQTNWTEPELFRGYTISIAGCPPSHHRTITQAVTQCGARVISDHSQADYTIVPHINPPCIPPRCNPVAHNWIEHSFFERKIVDPDKHWACRPVRLHHIPHSDQYAFSVCGFNLAEGQVIQRALKALNLKFLECPRRSEITHLFIGPDKTSARVQKVSTWTEKEVVDFDWLISLGSGERVTSGKLNTSAHAPGPPPDGLGDQRECTPTEVPQPLIDCVIYMTKKASANPHSRSIAACGKLGARVADKFDDTVTHLVHIGERSNDTTKEFRSAKSKGLHIVHPCWLTECKNKATRADELTFLHTYKPGMALHYETSPVPNQSQAQVTSTRPAASMSHSSPISRDHDLDLQEDEEFFNPNPADVTDEMLPVQSRHASPVQKLYRSHTDKDHDPLDHPRRKRDYPLLDSSPHLGSAYLGEERESRSAIKAPTSPYSSDMPRSSSPLQRPEPGVETQVGGFLEYLQLRNKDVEGPMKDKDSRRNRKRALADFSRTSSTGASGRPLPPSDEDQPADLSKNTGLHRTLSDLTHASPVRSDRGIRLDDNEESMKVTWDEPTGKRGILHAMHGANGHPNGRRADQRKGLTNSTSCDELANRVTALDQHPIIPSRRAGGSGPVVIDLASDLDASERIINGRATKRHKPRLMT